MPISDPSLLTGSQLLRAYMKQTPRSAQLFERAAGIFPGGVTHIGRYMRPHPVFIDRAAGSRKWDVDGNEYVDYFGGHGALLLGHNHPAVIEAARRQLEKGVHFGASHELEVEWAELIRSMIPCAERVRFTVTGTEATQLAFRVARAYTGKPKILRFYGHFHGWHDQVAFGAAPAAGVTPEMQAGIVLASPGDIGAVKEILASRDDIAGVILEPTGATFGQVPLPAGFLSELREVTAGHGVLLIFDEVITGFRVSPGGAQGHYSVTPDLASLAKIVAGGFPGAALVGRAAVLDLIGHKEAASGVEAPVIQHQGTYNAGPVSAAAGIATLQVIRDTDAVDRANRIGATLRDELNAVVRRKGLGWAVYGEFSAFHIFPSPAGEVFSPGEIQSGRVPWQKLKGATPPDLLHKIRAGFLVGGVDIAGWPGGLVSAVHSAEDVERTLAAFEATIGMLAEDGALG